METIADLISTPNLEIARATLNKIPGRSCIRTSMIVAFVAKSFAANTTGGGVGIPGYLR